MNKRITTVREAESYIKELFTKHSRDVSAKADHEVYEFNIKGYVSHPDYVNDSAYWERMSDEVESTVEELKEQYDWISTAYTVGRSGGYLVLITDSPVWDSYGDRALDGKDTKKRANELRTIAQELKDKVHGLTSMTEEEQEEYWSDFRPEDWDEQVKAKQEADRQAQERRQLRLNEVISYTPTDFYYLETTHRRIILNDRGDILLTIDKMCRQTRPDDWKVYGQQAGNGLVGYNRIFRFKEDGIAPRTVAWETAKEHTEKAKKLGMVIYNAPSNQYTFGGLGTVLYLTTANIDNYLKYFK